MGKVKIAPVFESIHFGSVPLRALGKFQTQKGKGLLNHIFWSFIGIPITSSEEKFELEINESRTEWKRTFGEKQFVTRTEIIGDVFKESKGIFEFEFNLKSDEEQLTYELIRFRVLTIPIPRMLSIKLSAICKQIENNKWVFDIETRSLFGQRIIRYRGDAEIR